MRVFFALNIFLLVSLGSFAQYSDVEVFNKLQKLDDKISLDENFDYDLVNTGVMHLTNKHRVKNKKKVLKYNKTLEEWSKIHSSEMRKYRFFDHVNRQNKLFRDIEDRAKYVQYDNYKELAENIYLGFVDLRNLPTYRDIIKTITLAFIDSKSHNMNLLNKGVEEMGGFILFKESSKDGYIQYYFTQSFGAQFKY